MNQMQAFLDSFKNPTCAYRIKPFWFWNSRLEKGEIRSQVRAFQQMGVGGFIIHARFGLETEYLSEAWMDLVEVAVQEAADLGMEVWLYDENLFPSGIGNTKVSRCPEYRPKFIEFDFFKPERSSEGAFVRLSLLPDGCQPFSVQDIDDDRAANPLIFRIEDNKIQIENCTVDTVAIFWLNTLQDEKDMIFGVDYLEPNTLKAFLQSTHEPYKKRFKSWFGTVIKGFFTDEPTLIPWHHDIKWYKNRKNGYCVPFTPGLMDEIHQAGLQNTDLGTIAPALFFDSPDQERAGLIRNIYWKTVSRLYADNFFKAYANWCEENNLMLTGHVLLEEGLYFNHIFQAGPLEGLKHLHVPGVDQLGPGSEFPSMSYMVEDLPHIPAVRTNVTGPKLVSSIAHTNGRRQVLSESFGIGGWSLQFQQMKAILDWEYALGVNLLCPHAFFYSIEGYRKFDAPPCHFHNTNAGLYRLFADYAARLSYALSQGEPVADTAVIYPSSGFRSTFAVGRQRADDRQVSDAYDLVCTGLLKTHRNYEILSEAQLAVADVLDGVLSLDSARLESRLALTHCSMSHLAFTTVIVPSLDAVGEGCRQVLDHFVRSGGKMLVLNAEREANRPAGKGRITEVETCLDLSQEWVLNHLSALYAQDGELGVRLVGTGHEQVYTLCRQLGDARIWFVANTDKDKPFHGWVDFRCSKLTLLNAETGDYEKRSGDWLPLDLAPAGSLLVLAEGVPYAAEKPGRPRRRAFHEIKVDHMNWTFIAAGENALPVTHWDFTTRTSGMQMEYRYQATLVSDLDLPLTHLVLDDVENRASIMGQSHRTLTCNDRTCPFAGTYIDQGFKKFRIENIQKGKNRIEIRISHAAWSGEPRPLTMGAVLTGEFALRENIPDQRWIMTCPPATFRLETWTRQGFPFYSGLGTYIRKLQLPDFSQLILKLEHIEGGARLIMDGTDLGTRLWAPWEWEIPTVVSGREVEIRLEITNTLANYFGSIHESGPKGQMVLDQVQEDR